MAETQKDTNILVNVGGVLTHWNSVSESGGDLTEYDSTPIGGPPEFNYDEDVRSHLEYTVATRVVGVDQAARQAVIDAFASGETFDSKASPSASGDMKITGPNQVRSVGRRFVVKNPTSSTSQAGNMELTIMLKECGATPA